MKRTILMTLILTFLVSLFAGCAASGAGLTSPQQTTGAPVGTTAPIEAPTKEATTTPTLPGMIETAYDYPIRRGMAGWDEMTTKEKALACQIPNETVKAMTTPALLETLYGYPRWEEVFSKAMIGSVVPQLSISHFVRDLNIGQELQSRDDLKEWINALDPSKFAVRSIMSAEEIEAADYCYAAAVDQLPYYDETVYTYPVTPESPEWATMTEAEKIAACQIPEDILDRLSPNALKTTMLNYPLLADAAAADDPQAAIKKAMESSNGIAELATRPYLAVALAGSDPSSIAGYAKGYSAHALDAYNDFVKTLADRTGKMDP